MQASSKIAALSNPLSGKNKRGAFAGFKSALANFPQIPHVAVSSPADIMASLEQFEQENIQLIIINGGDGTLQTVLTYLQYVRGERYQPELVLLKAGTTSMAFGDVGCKGRFTDVLEQIVNYVAGKNHQLKSVVRPVLRMRLPATNQTICGLFFGAGAIYSGILYCRQKFHTKGLRGEVGPSLAMIWFLLDWLTVNKLTVPARASVYVDDGEVISGEFNIITATTLRRLLMGAYPYWAEGDKSRHQVLSLIRRQPPRALRAFLKILRGQSPNVETDAHFYLSYCPAAVKIEIEDGFTLDGELFGGQGSATEVVLDTAGTVSFLTT